MQNETQFFCSAIRRMYRSDPILDKFAKSQNMFRNNNSALRRTHRPLSGVFHRIRHRPQQIPSLLFIHLSNPLVLRLGETRRVHHHDCRSSNSDLRRGSSPFSSHHIPPPHLQRASTPPGPLPLLQGCGPNPQQAQYHGTQPHCPSPFQE